MNILILGGGPAGLYAGLLIKKANPAHEVTIIERNPADVTYGWGVVFSDRTLASFQMADYKTYQQITISFVIWDAIDVRYRDETISCGGHVITAISRKSLLEILQKRCAELGVTLRFDTEINDLAKLPKHDLLIAADGLNSTVRKTYEEHFKPTIEFGKAKYIWLGANKVLDAFNFIFHENEHGFFTTHAYPFSGTTSTFIVECSEETWLNAGLDKADDAQSLAYCQQLLNYDLRGAPLQSNNSKWINFPTLKTQRWSLRGPKSKVQSPKSKPHNDFGPSTLDFGPRVVLLGDAAHTAHFSIGSGTKLAMEDAIALANALEQHHNLETALNEYEAERKPVVETFQRAAQESRTYFETIKRYSVLPPMQFAFQLLTRSGRISYDDLHFRDARFGDAIDRWYVHSARDQGSIAPSPMFAPFKLRDIALLNRAVMSPLLDSIVQDGTPNEEYISLLNSCARGGVGLIMTDICAVSPEGRVTPGTLGMYDEVHAAIWSQVVQSLRARSFARVGIQLGHAGRRGSTRPRAEGLDRPLREGNWPLLSASPIPYTPQSQVPKEMDRADMEMVRDQFARAVQMAHQAGFDLLQLHFAQGYLLASFLSPLTNVRTDDYGGSLENRMRYPLELFDAVRAIWPQDKPISVAIPASDCAKGGLIIEDAVVFARCLQAHGCDLVQVLVGQTTPASEPAYGRGFLTHYSDRIRNEAGIPTMVGGYLITSNDVNTVLAAGKGDLCVMEGT